MFSNLCHFNKLVSNNDKSHNLVWENKDAIKIFRTKYKVHTFSLSLYKLCWETMNLLLMSYDLSEHIIFNSLGLKLRDSEIRRQTDASDT